MKKQNNSKRLLFEAMHKVTGMPLNEDMYTDDQVTQNFDTWHTQKPDMDSGTYDNYMSTEEFIIAMEKSQEKDRETLKKMNPDDSWYNFFSQGIEARQKVIDSAKKQAGMPLSEQTGDLSNPAYYDAHSDMSDADRAAYMDAMSDFSMSKGEWFIESFPAATKINALVKKHEQEIDPIWSELIKEVREGIKRGSLDKEGAADMIAGFIIDLNWRDEDAKEELKQRYLNNELRDL